MQFKTYVKISSRVFLATVVGSLIFILLYMRLSSIFRVMASTDRMLSVDFEVFGRVQGIQYTVCCLLCRQIFYFIQQNLRCSVHIMMLTWKLMLACLFCCFLIILILWGAVSVYKICLPLTVSVSRIQNKKKTEEKW